MGNDIRRIMRDVKRLYEEVNPDKPLPPFYDESPDGKFKKTPVESQRPVKKGKELKRGVGGGGFADADPVDYGAFDVRRVNFESPERLREALRLIGEELDIGHPSYEIGPDGRTLIFHYWKSSENMRQRIEKAIKFFEDNDLSLKKDSINKY